MKSHQQRQDRPVSDSDQQASFGRERREVRLQPIRLQSGVQALESQERSTRREDEQQGSLAWEIAETLLLALLIFLAVRTVVLNFRVDGLSMEPALDTGQMILVNRQIYLHFDANDVLNLVPFVERDGENVVYPFHPPLRGDIIVFNAPTAGSDKPFIKRVIGLPGETVSVRDGQVLINGRTLDEDYLGSTATSWPGRPDGYELVVPEDHYFVLGDNRNNSTDSRSFGPVPMDSVIGKAWISYWPTAHLGILGTPSYAR